MNWKSSRGKIVFVEEPNLPPEDKCSDCRLCQAMCTLVHAHVANPKRSRIKVLRRGNEAGALFFVPVTCRQCEDHPCVDACPMDAWVEDETWGIFKLVEEECTGCQACIEACPYGEIFLDPVEEVALKCDLCGGEPQCVEFCPAGVLRMEIN